MGLTSIGKSSNGRYEYTGPSVATPGELCNRTAELLGVEPNATAIAWRTLRENSIVTTGGRGRSAAHCVPADAANLLIATIGKLPLKSVFKSWQRYSTLKGRENPTISLMEKVSITPELESLKGGHTFSEGMTALVASATSGTLQKFLLEGLKSKHDLAVAFASHSVRVRFTAPLPQAFINVHKNNHERAVGLRLDYTDIPAEVSEIMEWSEKPRLPDESGDLTHLLEITGNTILSLGELLRGSK
jgi:hypothetical protein